MIALVLLLGPPALALVAIAIRPARDRIARRRRLRVYRTARTITIPPQRPTEGNQ
ncbi:hypothetical protein BX265_6134 [Streptomyces sp. TLI_235]|nr:hypothetical protein [Streptomyces sp. TLI_235]PBC71524.1 hypothetical protein BX265_6134 [Streptomyces sp. TLI_235]